MTGQPASGKSLNLKVRFCSGKSTFHTTEATLGSLLTTDYTTLLYDLGVEVTMARTGEVQSVAHVDPVLFMPVSTPVASGRDYCTVTVKFTEFTPGVETVTVTLPVFGPVVY